MSTVPIIGVCIGTPTKGIGVTVLGGSGEVVEAVTVTPDTTKGPDGLIESANMALAHGLDIANAACPGALPLVVFEDIARPPGRKARAAAAREVVHRAQVAREVIRDALMLGIAPTVGVLTVPPIGDVSSESCPPWLSGPIPPGWRGTRGSRRESERTAWVAAMQARSTLVAAASLAGDTAAPATADDYPSALAAVIRAAEAADETALRHAAIVALYVVERPDGAPALTVDSLVTWAHIHGLYASSGG